MDPNEKVAQSAGQEDRLGFRTPSPVPRSLTPPTFPGNLSKCQRSEEGTRPPNQPDIATLKRVLQLLLPRVGTSLGSSRLLPLLCLDWANREMALGLDFGTLWTAELNSSNIIVLFCDCFASYEAPHITEIDLAVVEGLIVSAMQKVESRNEKLLSGRARLQKIITIVLESGHTLDWVPVYGSSIAQLFTSSPDEKILDRCLEIEQSNRNIEEICESQSEKVRQIH